MSLLWYVPFPFLLINCSKNFYSQILLVTWTSPEWSCLIKAYCQAELDGSCLNVFSLFYSTTCVLIIFIQSLIHFLFKDLDHIYICYFEALSSAKLIFSVLHGSFSKTFVLIAHWFSGGGIFSWLVMFVFLCWDSQSVLMSFKVFHNVDVWSCLRWVGVWLLLDQSTY